MTDIEIINLEVPKEVLDEFKSKYDLDFVSNIKLEIEVEDGFYNIRLINGKIVVDNHTLNLINGKVKTQYN